MLRLWICFIVWLVPRGSSSETQRQVVVKMRYVRPRAWYFRSRVYFRSERACGKVLLPNQFQKRAKSFPLIGQKKIFLPNQWVGLAKTTLSPFYTKWFFSSIEIHVVVWTVQREDSCGEFQEGDIRRVLSTAELRQKISADHPDRNIRSQKWPNIAMRQSAQRDSKESNLISLTINSAHCCSYSFTSTFIKWHKWHYTMWHNKTINWQKLFTIKSLQMCSLVFE